MLARGMRFSALRAAQLCRRLCSSSRWRAGYPRSVLFKPPRFASAVLPVYLFIFFAAIIAILGSAACSTSTWCSLYRSALLRMPATVADINLNQHVDPCSRAVPQPLVQFDPSARASGEFSGLTETAGEELSSDRVFSTFFAAYLFEPHSDFVANLSAAGSARVADVRASLSHAQRALRLFSGDASITVRDYRLGYSHLDRMRGSRYILHVHSDSEGNRARRDVVAVQRTFDGQCYLSVLAVASTTFDDAIYMVVPYSARPLRLEWFLRQFDRLRVGGVNARLVLAVCREVPDDVSSVKKLVGAMKSGIDVFVVAVPGDRTGFFSRSIAIREGSNVVPSDSIMFISDVDMYIFPYMFDSCRHNAIQGSQVYFPVFYSLYARSSRIEKNAGYWRDSSYGMSCMYRSDFDEVGAYERAESTFVGWGGEDIALSRKFSEDLRYEVFRAVEPALRHRWHKKVCEPMTPAFDDCVAISFEQLGKMSTVGKFLLEKKIDAQSLFGDVERAGDDFRVGKSGGHARQGNVVDARNARMKEMKKMRASWLRRLHKQTIERRALKSM